jgi:class 3 adenylate cyclase
VTEHPSPTTLSLALCSVVGTAVEGRARTRLLSIIRPHGEETDRQAGAGYVVPFPAPRRSPDDDPSAA